MQRSPRPPAETRSHGVHSSSASPRLHHRGDRCTDARESDGGWILGRAACAHFFSPIRPQMSFRRFTETEGKPLHSAPQPAGHRSLPPRADWSTELNHAATHISHLHPSPAAAQVSPRNESGWGVSFDSHKLTSRLAEKGRIDAQGMDERERVEKDGGGWRKHKAYPVCPHERVTGSRRLSRQTAHCGSSELWSSFPISSRPYTLQATLVEARVHGAVPSRPLVPALNSKNTQSARSSRRGRDVWR